MRRHTRSLLAASSLVAIAVAVTLGLALTADTGKAVAVGGTSPFEDVKNVIFFIGDGMADNQLEVGRQIGGGSLKMDDIWEAEGHTDTRSLGDYPDVPEDMADYAVTDSAAGGTALSTGRTTWNDWVAYGPDQDLQDNSIYSPIDLVAFETVLERAQTNGKATGLVTDLELSDATPAVFASHVDDRDKDIEITEQMRDHEIEALFSGNWGSSSILDDQSGVTYVSSLTSRKGETGLQEYLDGDADWPAKMYGFFGSTTLAYTLDREEEGVLKKQPTLPQLTEACLGILGDEDRYPDGFFVMVEAGSDDWGGHARDAAWIGAEIRELDDAIQTAYDWAEDRDDTLIVLTADHECGGLVLYGDTNYDALADQMATTEWMWGLIKKAPPQQQAAKAQEVLAEYTAVDDLSLEDAKTLVSNREMGISDVLAEYYHIGWGWDDWFQEDYGWYGSDEAEHTATPVPVMAWGPGAEVFEEIQEDPSELVGQALLDAVSH